MAIITAEWFAFNERMAPAPGGRILERDRRNNELHHFDLRC